MAKIIGPCYSLEASGKMGPFVFSKNGSGPIVRQWYPPVNPRSFSQTSWQRLYFQKVAFSWNNLDAASAQKWLSFAQTWSNHSSNSRSNGLTAHNYFFKFNLRRLLCGATISSNPPLSPVCSYFPNLQIVWTSSGASLSWDLTIPNGGGITVRQVRNLLSINFRGKKGAISNVFVYGTTSPQLVTPPCGGGSLHGPGPAFNCNTWLHFWVQAIDNFGRATPELFFPIRSS